jgi:hypothetical protein
MTGVTYLLEAIPPNTLSPRGRPVQMDVFINADHAGGKNTR